MVAAIAWAGAAAAAADTSKEFMPALAHAQNYYKRCCPSIHRKILLAHGILVE